MPSWFRNRSAMKSWRAPKWLTVNRVGEFLPQYAIPAGFILAAVAIFGLCLYKILHSFRQVQPSTTSIMWWALAALLLVSLFWIRPDPRKWSWGKILKIVWILIILVPSFVVAISGVIGLVVRASTPKVIATSVAGSTNLLITSEPGVWSDWQNLPSNVKKVTILSDKELDLELQQADGGVVKAKHLPGRQIDLGREKLTGPVMAFRSRPASTSGNKVFQYTAICDLTEQQR